MPATGCGYLFVYHLQIYNFFVFFRSIKVLVYYAGKSYVVYTLTVIGTIAMSDYVEAGTIVFLFTIAEWLESRSRHKVRITLAWTLNFSKCFLNSDFPVSNNNNTSAIPWLLIKSGNVMY